MTRLWLTALLLCCLGCPPGAQQLTTDGIKDAVRTNNEMVASLTALQERARFQRKATLLQAARMADSWAAGQKDLDTIEARYVPAFDAFVEAERCQNALAEGLELARAMVKTGEAPDMVALLTLYMHIQAVYNGVAATLSEAP